MDDSLPSRAAALGWKTGPTLVMVGMTNGALGEVESAELRRSIRRAARGALVGIHGEDLIIIARSDADLDGLAQALLPNFGPGPVVIGPAATTLIEVARSTRAALAGVVAAPAWSLTPRPVQADDLLPERVLVGDPTARERLLALAYDPIAKAGGSLKETVGMFLACGRSLELCSKTMFVHPNTVRYRLKKVTDLTGWDALDAQGRRRALDRLRARSAPGIRACAFVGILQKAGCTLVVLGPPARVSMRHPSEVLAIVCPGQGAQFPGMLSPWLELPFVSDRLHAFSEAAGVDLVRHGTTSDADTIRDTAVAQPLLVATALATARELLGDIAAHPTPTLIAGHSVGEFAAAALAGVLTDEETLRLVSVRGTAMAEAAAAAGPASMAAVIGGDPTDVESFLAALGLTPANMNGGGQVVAAGDKDAIAALVASPPPGTRVIEIQVAGAFHTADMRPAVDRLTQAAVGSSSPATPSPSSFPTPMARPSPPARTPSPA